MPRILRLAVLAAIATLTTSAWAKGRASEVLVGKHVRIAVGEIPDQDLMCVACTVPVNGSLDGDISCWADIWPSGRCILSGFGSGPNWFQQRSRPAPPAGATAG